MVRTWRVGASAAAVLPAALAGAVLVSAPFAGTTTAPLGYVRAVAVHPPTVFTSSCVVLSRARTC